MVMTRTRLRNHMTHGFLYSKLTIESYQDFDSQNDFVKIRKIISFVLLLLFHGRFPPRYPRYTIR